MSKVTYSIENKVARVTLNRPSVQNAFDEEVITELTTYFDKVRADNSVRILVLQSEGKNFSAGADLQWMKKMASFTPEQNYDDAKRLALMLNSLYTLNKPTIARVQGAAFGGAIGLVACCDIVIASKLSKYCFSEVKLGLIPATISPYVIEAIGPRHAKRLFMTAEMISARRARRIGLISETVSEEELDQHINAIIAQILKNGPNAVSLSKALVHEVKDKLIDQELIQQTSQSIASARVSKEGQAGLNAFLEKRKPDWNQHHD